MLKPPTIHRSISPLQQLKNRLKQQQQKLSHLKNQLNPTLLTKIRTLQSQIKRLQIINLSSSINPKQSKQNLQILNSLFQKSTILNDQAIQLSCESYEQERKDVVLVEEKLKFLEQEDQQELNIDGKVASKSKSKLMGKSNIGKYSINNGSVVSLSMNQQLNVLKNVSTKNYIQAQSNHGVNSKSQLYSNAPAQSNNEHKITSPSNQTYLQTIQAQSSTAIMQSKIYPTINRYLTNKTALISKLIQLNPDKRHNNSLLISHQRVLMKQHLDLIRNMNKDLKQKNQKLNQQISRDFMMVRSKWEESERDLKGLIEEQRRQKVE